MRICFSSLAFIFVLAPHDQVLAEAQNLPTRRAGLWEIRMTEEGRNTPPQVMQQCIDAKTDQMMNAFGGGLGAELCSKQEIRKVGATLVINAECEVGPMRSVSESVVSGDFNSNYTVRVTTTVEGLPAAARELVGGTRVIQARWIGACKLGQRPGDIAMSDGRTMNIFELKRVMGGVRDTGEGRPLGAAPGVDARPLGPAPGAGDARPLGLPPQR
jgi:Protein of unknown function (DUF3617)